MLKICEKLRPFSHQSGTACLVPGSDWIVRAFPSKLSISGFDVSMGITGPVRDFTVQMDLERDSLWIWGIAKEGHFRIKLSADELGLSLFVDRCPKAGLEIGGRVRKVKEKILLQEGGRFLSPKKMERLSLGNWKSQDWEGISRRNQPSEWVPILYALGQKVPRGGKVHGGAALLIDNLEAFFLGAFEGILVPHLSDPLHQGLFVEEGVGDPLALLTLGYQTIRKFFLQDNQILPSLPSEWHAGRLLHLQSPYGRIDLEWTKGMLRQMVLHAEKDGEALFVFPKKIQSFRLNGKRIRSKKALFVEAGKKYLLDQFQK